VMRFTLSVCKALKIRCYRGRDPRITGESSSFGEE
jgi:hypothetical protein